MQQTLVTPDRIPEWILGTVTMGSSSPNWKGIALKGYHYDRQEAEIPPMRDHMIVAHDGAPTIMRRSSGESWKDATVEPGKISLLTRAEQSTWSREEPIRVRHVYLGHDCLEVTAQTVFGRDAKSVEVDDQMSTEDPLRLNRVQMLEDELQHGGLGQRLMIGAMRNQIAVHLLRRYARIRIAEETGSSFSLAQRKRIIDLIENQLNENTATLCDRASGASDPKVTFDQSATIASPG